MIPRLAIYRILRKVPYSFASKCALISKDWNDEVCYSIHNQPLDYCSWDSLVPIFGDKYRINQRRYTVIKIFDGMLKYRSCYMGSSSPNYTFFIVDEDGNNKIYTVRDYAFDRLIKGQTWISGTINGTWVQVNISGGYYIFPFNILHLEPTKLPKK